MGASRVAVVGAGWAGLAAAVEAVGLGHDVTLFEMAPQVGGRARSVAHGDGWLDNGQHILIGAYVDCLALMKRVGVDPASVLHRMPLSMVGPDGLGLRLGGGPAMPAFARAVMTRAGWRAGERVALCLEASRWMLRRFRAPDAMTVAELTARLPRVLRDELIDPLCVAALNTPSEAASASVFLRVLRDALFTAPGSSDLLLPSAPLDRLLPQPAAAWLRARGSAVRESARVQAIAADDQGWQVDGDRFDAVVLATSAVEAARLVQPVESAWSRRAVAFGYEPIVTVYLQCEGARLPEPMLMLPSNASDLPAQFVFDHGQLGGPTGRLAFVVSGAAGWIAKGMEAVTDATMEQARRQLAAHLPSPAVPLRTLTEKRATFRCIPGLDRPPAVVRPGLMVAGDYVDGPYPATLEGAVRSGFAAARQLGRG